MIDDPGSIAEPAGERVLRNDPRANFIGDYDDRIDVRLKRGKKLGHPRFPIGICKHQIRQPERQAVNQTGAFAIHLSQRTKQITRFVIRHPLRPAARLMLGDARGHLVVMRLGRGNIDRRPPKAERPLFRDAAFAGSRAARYEYRLAHPRRKKQKRERKKTRNLCHCGMHGRKNWQISKREQLVSRIRARIDGHFGEFLQGTLGPGGPVVLVTVPCPLVGVRAHIVRSGPFRLYGGADVGLTVSRARHMLERLGIPQPGASILKATYPAGYGTGVSTAAILALAKGAANAAGAADPSTGALAEACHAVEGATDPLMMTLPANWLWASRLGRPECALPPLPAMEIIGGISSRPARTDPKDQDYPDISDLVPQWSKAAEAGDVATLGALASTSASRCRIHRGMPDVLGTLPNELGALGQVMAHSGALSGLIFRKGEVPHTAAQMLRERGLAKILKFRVGTS